jgi:hypothetical protein
VHNKRDAIRTISTKVAVDDFMDSGDPTRSDIPYNEEKLTPKGIENLTM